VAILWAACPVAALESTGNAQANVAAAYVATVDRRLDVPPDEAQRYGELLTNMLEQAGLGSVPSQYYLVVDRSPQVQAVFLYWRAQDASPVLMGASPASTGRPVGFEHFETPTGVFPHTLENPDFRSEGTKNEFGIRGYGARGLRVFDFGWQQARKGWGNRGTGQMRLQLHATDPDHLEQRLGTVQSKGCIRIPASLNRLMDTHGLLDADYESGQREGRSYWVLRPDRTPVPGAGRYLVVVDTTRTDRPSWSPLPPALAHPRRVPAL
jgi:hypothetical protein